MIFGIGTDMVEINRIKNFTYLEIKEFLANHAEEVSLSFRHLFAFIQNFLLNK